MQIALWIWLRDVNFRADAEMFISPNIEILERTRMD